MTAILFLAVWALRSSILVICGALILAVLRVKDPSIRWAAWTAILVGSLIMPAMSAVLPGVPLTMIRTARAPVAAVASVVVSDETGSGVVPALTLVPTNAKRQVQPSPFNWVRSGLIFYAMISLGLLLRLCVGV